MEPRVLDVGALVGQGGDAVVRDHRLHPGDVVDGRLVEARNSVLANRTALPEKIAVFLRLSQYMVSMNPSMMAAIIAPMYSAIQNRAWLNQTWSMR